MLYTHIINTHNCESDIIKIGSFSKSSKRSKIAPNDVVIVQTHYTLLLYYKGDYKSHSH